MSCIGSKSETNQRNRLNKSLCGSQRWWSYSERKRNHITRLRLFLLCNWPFENPEEQRREGKSHGHWHWKRRRSESELRSVVWESPLVSLISSSSSWKCGIGVNFLYMKKGFVAIGWLMTVGSLFHLIDGWCFTHLELSVILFASVLTKLQSQPFLR